MVMIITVILHTDGNICECEQRLREHGTALCKLCSLNSASILPTVQIFQEGPLNRQSMEVMPSILVPAITIPTVRVASCNAVHVTFQGDENERITCGFIF